MNLFQKQLESLRQQQQLLYILVFSLVTVLIWVSIGLFTSQKKTGISKELLELAKPLAPTINSQVVDSIEKERMFSEQDLSNFPIYKVLISKEGQESVVTIDTPEAGRLGGSVPKQATQSLLSEPTPTPSPSSGSATVLVPVTSPASESGTTF